MNSVRLVLLTLLIAALGGLLYLNQQNSSSSAHFNITQFQVGEPYPRLELTTVNGKQIDLSKPSGKIRIVEFAAVACPASQTFAGAHQHGAMAGLSLQPGLPAFPVVFEQYSRGFSLHGEESPFEYIQVLTLDRNNQSVDEKELIEWKEHFQITDSSGTTLTKPTQESQAMIPMGAIPGFHIIDKDGVLQESIVRRQDQAKLYTHVLPTIGRLITPEKVVTTSSRTYRTRGEIKKEISKLTDEYVKARDFTGIEDYAKELASDSKPTTTFGNKLAYYYNSLVENNSLSYKKTAEFHEFLDAWKARYPKSDHRVVVSALAEKLYAFQARGSSFSHTVSSKAYRAFTTHVEKLKKAVQEAEVLNDRNPILPVAKVYSLTLDPNGSAQDILDVYTDAKGKGIIHLDLASQIVFSLLPRWKGNEQIVGDFIRQVDTDTSNQFGKIYYAKLSFFLLANGESPKAFANDYKLSWELADQGFRALYKKYPEEEFNLQQHISLAYDLGQRERLKELLKLAPTQWTPEKKAIWKKHQSYLRVAKSTELDNTSFKLLRAVSDGDSPTVKSLLQSGGDLTIQDPAGRSLLQLAIRKRHIALAVELLRAGAPIDLIDRYGDDPYLESVLGGSLAITKVLVDKGVDPYRTNSKGQSALSIAIHKNDVEMTDYLVRNFPKLINIKDQKGKTALMRSCVRGKTKILKILLDNGAKVDLQDQWGYSALHYAAQGGHPEIIQLLLDKGADRDMPSSDGRRPVDIARKAQKAEAAKLLQ